MGIIICPLGFNVPDRENPKYSFREVDFYGFIPFDSQLKFKVKNHRLSLRKNLESNEFELYRFYHDDESVEVIFSGSIEDALRIAHNEWIKFWGHIGAREPDKICRHRYPIVDKYFCPIYRGEVNVK